MEASEAAVLTPWPKEQWKNKTTSQEEWQRLMPPTDVKDAGVWCLILYVNLARLQGPVAWLNFSPDVTVKVSF